MRVVAVSAPPGTALAEHYRGEAAGKVGAGERRKAADVQGAQRNLVER